jgi:single-stranded DNA-binding protein
VDAELDWREWTDQQENKREAVTLKARQVLFEGGRSTHTAAGEGSEQNGAPPPAAGPSDAAPVGVSAAGSEGTASADDLPF